MRRWSYLRPSSFQRTSWWVFACRADDCPGGVAVPPCPAMNGSTPRCPKCGGALYVVVGPEPPRQQRAAPTLIFGVAGVSVSYDHRDVASRISERNEQRERARRERNNRRAHQAVAARAGRVAA